MSRLVYKRRPSSKEIKEKYEVFELGISELYAEELSNINYQIGLNNDNYVRAQINAAGSMIKQSGSYQGLDDNAEVQRFIEGVYEKMPKKDNELEISRSALQKVLQGCMEIPEPVLTEHQKGYREGDVIFSTKPENIKFNLPFLLATLTNAVNFQKGVALKHIYWIIVAVLSQYVLMKQQVTIQFSEDEAAVVCELYGKYNGCAAIREVDIVEHIEKLKSSGKLSLEKDIQEILKKLSDYKCIELSNGIIRLIEKFDLT